MHDTVYLSVLVAAVLAGLALLFVQAPYGRYVRSGWGPTMSTRWAWIIMESPAVLAFVYFYVQGETAGETVSLLFLGMWQLHYVHRTFIYPLRMRGSAARQTPVLIPSLAVLFNIANAYLNGSWISNIEAGYTLAWLSTPMFLIGFVLFFAGFIINRWADAKLRALRPPGDAGYYVPRGGMYEWISCPNYFGEILQWFGWAIATWSTAGLAFALFTTANLAPRALSHHKWYRQKFEDYPTKRKALIPGVL